MAPPTHRCAWLVSLALAGCSAPVEDLLPPQIALEAPDLLDLGWVAREQAVGGRFWIENVGTHAIGLSGVEAREIPGTITVEVGLDPTVLAPGRRVAATVRVIAGPTASGEVTLPVSVIADGLAIDDARMPVVEVRARVSPSGLVAEPNPLTIGPVPYLETMTGTVGIRNLRNVAVDVYALRIADGRAQYDEAVTRGAFGPLPEVSGAGLITTLAPGESTVVDIEYTAPDGPGEAKEQATWRVGTCLDPERCALDLVVQGVPDHEAPRLLVRPRGLHFGPTPVGAEVERELHLSNAGRRPLALSGFALSGPESIQGVLPDDVLLQPDQGLLVRFRYAPRAETLDNATFTFATNDPLQRQAEVRVTGSGVVLPPCRVDVSPPILEFGVVEVFESRVLEAEVRSTGEQPCLLFDPHVEHESGTEAGTFALFGDPPTSTTLHPGETATYAVAYGPGRPGQHRGRLVLRTSGGDPVVIPLRGRTPDDVGLSCTPERTVEVGSPVALVAALHSTASARSYQWRLLSGPLREGAIDGAFLPDANTGPQVELLPRALGAYDVSVEVETTDGERFACTTRVLAESSGLKATLTWDGPGDLDLHLHNERPTPWFGDDDCHFDNLRPVWVSDHNAGTGPNPTLDRDDTSGDGPEHISIRRPRLGTRYTVAVSHFERARGRTARVQVFCGRAAVSLDLTSRPFGGDETGACTRNDFWAVATIVFTAPDMCTVERIDEYRSTQQACVAF